jgi:hypothetical protein
MPFIDLNTPTELLFQWSWLLVTRANAAVYALLVVVFLIGVLVRLPGEESPAAATAPRVDLAGATTTDGEPAS